ncbi:MAG: TlyA family RNA methyltransferase [Oscillospiraceae bacterium]|nr:TlyA family RNA methyltransferase [Oscillospiraceae bacterium]
MTRLDAYLRENGFTESRSKAHELIRGGSVTVGGDIVTKPSALICDNARVEVTGAQKYVSRAGYKLETAVNFFGLTFAGKICLDAGASTGGFTDLMLQNGAEKVYAVDVGENQLHGSLHENPRVVSLEKQDIRTLSLAERVDFIAADLSFISLKAIIPAFGALLKPRGGCAVLIKPQFEAGRVHMKNGVLTDEKRIAGIVRDLEGFIRGEGYEVVGTVESQLNEKGKNKEFICFFRL